MPFSSYMAKKVLNHILTSSTTPFVTTTSVFMSLHTASPGKTCTNAPVASCPRVVVPFAGASDAGGSATSINNAAAAFAVSSTGFVTDFALWDGSDTGTANPMFYGALNTSKAFNSGDTINLASAALSITLD